MAVQMPDQRIPMSDREFSSLCESINRMEAQIVVIRSAVLTRDRSVIDAQLALSREATDEEFTLLESAGLPWSPSHEAVISLLELQKLGRLPVLVEDPRDNG
jgi:hypothetical protein